MTIDKTAWDAAWRDYVTAGVPESGDHDPEKADIRALVAAAPTAWPIPLSYFLVTTPEAALQAAHDAGYKCIAFDEAYTFTGGVTITAQRFQIWGFGNIITKSFSGDLFTLTSASRFTAMRDLRVLAQGDTYTGKVIADSGGGNGWYENLYCTDAEDRVYEEVLPGAFNRGMFIGGNVGCVDSLRAAIKINELVDTSVTITGNGKIFGTISSTGVALDCGKAQELKVFGMTCGEPPIINGSVKSHFSNCRLTTRDEEIIFDPDGTSSLLTLDNCSFGVPVTIYAPSVRLVGCRFKDLTLDCTVSQVAPIQVTGTLVYGPNFQGAAVRPGGVSRMTNTASTTFSAIDGDTFTLAATGDRTLTAPLSPSPGQVVDILYTAVNGDRTLTLDTGAGAFFVPASITLSATTEDETDIITCKYNRTSDQWNVLNYIKGTAAPTPGPAFFGAGSYTSQSGNGVDFNISEPPTLTTGALLLGLMASKNNQTHTWPAGWTKVAQDHAGASFTQSWAWHIVDGTETGYVNVLVGGTNAEAGIILQYTGVNATPIGNAAVGSSSSAVTTRDVASISTTANNSRVVYAIMASSGGSGTDADAGGSWIERGDFNGVPTLHATYGDQYVATSGSASGAIALTGSVSATYVARQIELMAV